MHRWSLLEAILAELHRLLNEPGWAALVDRRLFARGRWVQLSGAGHGIPRCARVARVAASGGLVVHDAAGAEYTCFSGSTRPLDSSSPGVPAALKVLLCRLRGSMLPPIPTSAI